MDKYSDIEALFIKEELDKHSEYLSDLFVDDIGRKKLVDSGKLLSVFTNANPFKISQNSNEITLSLKFPTYGRFIEIQQRKPIQIETSKENAAKWKGKQKPKRKKTDWYTRNVYGSQNLLIGRLMYGLGDIEMKRLKGILEGKDK